MERNYSINSIAVKPLSPQSIASRDMFKERAILLSSSSSMDDDILRSVDAFSESESEGEVG
jgi:hypothetical protein